MTQKYFRICFILLVIVLLILQQKIRLFNKNKYNANDTIKIDRFFIADATQGCAYHSGFYFFVLQNCEELKIGEEYELFGTVVESTDTLFLKQIRLKIHTKELFESEGVSVNTWFGKLLWWRTKIKLNIATHLSRYASQSAQNLIQGLLWGQMGEVDPAFKKVISQAGLQHLVAASGYNVSLIMVGLINIFSHILKGKKKWWLVIIGTWLYVFFAGFSESLLRAALMGTFSVLSSRIFGRMYHIAWSLLMTVFFLSLFNSYIWWSISFQLSVLATLGILMFAPKAATTTQLWLVAPCAHRSQSNENIWDVIWQYCTENTQVSLAALIFVFPLLCFYFEKISLLSVVSTTVVAWLIPLATQSSLLVLLVSVLSNHFSWLAHLLVKVFVLPIKLLENLLFLLGGSDVFMMRVTISQNQVLFWWGSVVLIWLMLARARRKHI